MEVNGPHMCGKGFMDETRMMANRPDMGGKGFMDRSMM